MNELQKVNEVYQNVHIPDYCLCINYEYVLIIVMFENNYIHWSYTHFISRSKNIVISHKIKIKITKLLQHQVEVITELYEM